MGMNPFVDGCPLAIIKVFEHLFFPFLFIRNTEHGGSDYGLKLDFGVGFCNAVRGSRRTDSAFAKIEYLGRKIWVPRAWMKI